VIGNPIKHSLSPYLHQQFAKQCHKHIIYDRIVSSRFQLPETLARFHQKNGKGLNITAPFKFLIWPYVDGATELAQQSGAINTLYWDKKERLIGANTDGIGLLQALKNQAVAIHNKKLLILGAGGAASSVISALLYEVNTIYLINRTLCHALTLQKKLQKHPFIHRLNIIEDFSSLPTLDLIINTLSTPWPIALFDLLQSHIHPDLVCYDLTYNRNTLTSFLKWCQSYGAKRCIDGYSMLVEQAAESFYLWEGVKPITRGFYSTVTDFARLRG
jgi:shikimate dehydrogenase